MLRHKNTVRSLQIYEHFLRNRMPKIKIIVTSDTYLGSVLMKLDPQPVGCQIYHRHEIL